MTAISIRLILNANNKGEHSESYKRDSLYEGGIYWKIAKECVLPSVWCYRWPNRIATLALLMLISFSLFRFGLFRVMRVLQVCLRWTLRVLSSDWSVNNKDNGRDWNIRDVEDAFVPICLAFLHAWTAWMYIIMPTISCQNRNPHCLLDLWQCPA